MTALLTSSYVNHHRDTKKHPRPLELPVPWRSEAEREQVTPEERASLREQLLRRSAFASEMSP